MLNSVALTPPLSPRRGRKPYDPLSFRERARVRVV
jgi:hypothetical protein